MTKVMWPDQDITWGKLGFDCDNITDLSDLELVIAKAASRWDRLAC
jgi:hypothetical protein